MSWLNCFPLILSIKLCEQVHDDQYSDQLLSSQARVTANGRWFLSVANEDSDLTRYLVDAQADMSLRWARSHFTSFVMNSFFSSFDLITLLFTPRLYYYQSGDVC